MTSFTVNARTNNAATGVTDPDNAHNGYAGDFAAVAPAAEAQDVQFVVDGFVNDPDPSNRGTLALNVWFRYDAQADEYTKFAVYIRPTGASAWTKLDEDTNDGASNWNAHPASANKRQFSITTNVGSDAASGWEVGYQIYAGTVGSPNLPTFSPA